jgi:hypothetical protein
MKAKQEGTKQGSSYFTWDEPDETVTQLVYDETTNRGVTASGSL